MPIDRSGPRERLAESLDAVFAAPLDPRHHLDAVESKLFGIGSESYVVGSHEFYLGYAAKKQKLYCLDAGHFHPTETIADKISSLLLFVPEILLHVSRGVRWDSDHVVQLDDPTRALMEALVRGGYLGRTHIGLDYFDASIHRVAAWVIGHAGHAEGTSARAARGRSTACAATRTRATRPAASRWSRKPRACPSARSGTSSAAARMCRSASSGWTP